MKLSEIFSLSFAVDGCDYDADIFGLSFSSVSIKHGDIFVAVRGASVDGIRFVPDAVNRGAVAIVYDSRSVVDAETLALCKEKNVAMFCVPDAEIDAARIAKLVYSNAPKHIIAITGTNGKTTIVHFTEQLLNSIGINETATIGTMGMSSRCEKFAGVVDAVNTMIGVNPLTTQDTITTHKIL
ncbi:MAG: Mur ligase domain-containing protein, partial [Rickettsiales bacterium]|nr:Mur ligase domain-containing protein [Rickettsiales bacterium]